MLVLHEDPSIRTKVAASVQRVAPTVRVVAATQPEAALRRSEHPATLLVLPIHGVQIEGIEVLRALRRRGDRTPVLFLRGPGDDDIVDTAMAMVGPMNVIDPDGDPLVLDAALGSRLEATPRAIERTADRREIFPPNEHPDRPAPARRRSAGRIGRRPSDVRAADVPWISS